MQNAKRIFRANAVKIRDELSKAQRIQKSVMIKDKLLTVPEFKDAQTVMCYVDFKSEVMTREFIIDAMKLGKKITVPLINRNNAHGSKLVASLLENIDTDLEKGNLGIYEPKNESTRLICPKEIDIAIIPGVAFDLQRRRMGYGKRYYDEFLTDIRENCIKIGACFDVQLFECIPYEEHDILMDMVITENRIIK